MKHLDDPSSPTYQALCWIVTKDDFVNEYQICDGTLLQRFVLAVFYISEQEISFIDFDSISHKYTCDWTGITCDSNNKFVHQINLSNVNLHGTIVTHLGLLQSLEVVDISSNKLTGSLVAEIGLLRNIKTLNVTNNALDGTIDPIIFVNLPNLATLDLSNNGQERYPAKYSNFHNCNTWVLEATYLLEHYRMRLFVLKILVSRVDYIKFILDTLYSNILLYAHVDILILFK